MSIPPTATLTRTQRPRPAPSAATPIVHRGACTACVHAPDCTHPRSADRPVIECDEATLPAPVVAVVAPAPAAVVEPTTLRGLCVNCDQRTVCTLRKPEGGVWRCEEYV